MGPHKDKLGASEVPGGSVNRPTQRRWLPRDRRSGKPILNRPGLRLVGRLRPMAGGSRENIALNQPMAGPTDPRWVLAVRTAEQMEGEILSPERREQLQRLGKVLGLTPFSVSLIIAIIQDQARRGYAAEDCPTAGEPQLRMVRLPGESGRRSRAFRLAFAVAAMLAIELAILQWWWLG